MERRNEPRVNGSFPGRVWAFDVQGNPFSADCTIENISNSGVYASVPGAMKPSGDISFAVWLGSKNGTNAGLRGFVIRSELKPDGNYGVGVAITRREPL